MLNEGSFRLDMKMLGDIALVLDASESAAKYEGAVLQLAAQLLEKLPAGMHKKLYFLGNGREYDCARFAQQGAAWWRENVSRGSFIAPVAAKSTGSRLVVIGSGRIFDLEDYAEDLGAELLLADIGDAPLGGDVRAGKEVEHPEIAELLRLVHDPVEAVEIGGEAFLPYLWNNPEYKLSLEGGVTLRAAHPQNPAVTVAGWGSGIRARIQRSASRDEVALERAELEIDKEWRPLAGKEAGIVRDAVQGKTFTCPVCGKPHPPAILRCHEGSSLLGEPVLPSLANKKGFILFRVEPDSVLYRFHPVNAFRLGERKAALLLVGGARVYDYDESGEQWAERGELAPYFPVQDGFLLVV